MAKIERLRTSINYRVTRDDAEHVDIDIYGDIGETQNWWDDDDTNVTAKDFLDLVRSARGKSIDLHINSAGGSVFDAYAMMAALRDHDGKVTAHVDGIAASAASWLCAAADEVLIAKEAWMMIHDASGYVFGNSSEMRETADYLDKVDDHIAEIYAEGGKEKKQYYVDAMHATTWYTAQEAVEHGLADAIDEGVKVQDIAASADKHAFDSAPDALKAMVRDGIAAKSNPFHTVITAVAKPAVLTSNRTGGQEPPAGEVQEHYTRIGDRIINLDDYRNED